MVEYIYPLISTITSGAFTVALVIQYMKRRKLHQLIWSISLFMFFLTTLFEFLAAYYYTSNPGSLGWTPLMYKLYYVLTPPMVALMGTGSLYLLTHKPYGKIMLIYTIIVTIPLFALGLTADVAGALETAVKEVGGTEIAGAAMPSYVRIFSPMMTIPGGIFLIVGALYSFWLDKTRKYNLLVALGGLFPFIGGLRARFGMYEAFYFLELIGIVILFTGFLLSWEYIAKREALGKVEKAVTT